MRLQLAQSDRIDVVNLIYSSVWIRGRTDIVRFLKVLRRAALALDRPRAPVLGRLQRDGVGWLCLSDKEVAVDRHTMLLIGSAVVAVLFIAYMLFGPGAAWIPQ
jgi:hypothetical protein